MRRFAVLIAALGFLTAAATASASDGSLLSGVGPTAAAATDLAGTTISPVIEEITPALSSVVESPPAAAAPAVEETIAPVIEAVAPVVETAAETGEQAAGVGAGLGDQAAAGAKPVIAAVKPVVEAAEPVIASALPVATVVAPALEPVVKAADPVLETVKPAIVPVVQLAIPLVEVVEPLIPPAIGLIDSIVRDVPGALLTVIAPPLMPLLEALGPALTLAASTLETTGPAGFASLWTSEPGPYAAPTAAPLTQMPEAASAEAVLPGALPTIGAASSRVTFDGSPWGGLRPDPEVAALPAFQGSPPEPAVSIHQLTTPGGASTGVSIVLAAILLLFAPRHGPWISRPVAGLRRPLFASALERPG